MVNRRAVGRRRVNLRKFTLEPRDGAVGTAEPVEKSQFLLNATAEGPLPIDALPDFPVPRFARGYAIWPSTAPEHVGGRRLKATELTISPVDIQGAEATQGLPRTVQRGEKIWTLAGISNNADTTQAIMAAQQLKGWRVGLAQVDTHFGIYRR